MGWTDRLAKVFLNESTVINKEKIADQAFRLTVQSEGLKNIAYTPGNHLRVFVGMNTDHKLGDKVRTYSIWQLDKDSGTADLAVCTHSNGPGSTWVQTVQEGDYLYCSNPTGKFTLDTTADHYFFIGDASALGHLYEIRRHLPSDKTFDSFIYSAHKGQLFEDIDGTSPFKFYDAEGVPVDEVQMLLKESTSNDPKTIYYVGGDGRLCVALNRYLRNEQGVNSKVVKTKPFWMPNKKGLE
ncbi:MAG: siderophore-interacting protein [Phaeodactylibacter sp.]|nr:siderophore-interacting protein [Phaeodactylibacter sp.]